MQDTFNGIPRLDRRGCMMSRRLTLARLLTLTATAGLTGLALLSQGASAAAAPGDWPQYLHGPQHSSRSLATAFTPSNAAAASQVWHWQPPAVTGKPAPRLDASPTVVAGRVYIGAQSGGFFALNEATGAKAWSRQLDTEPHVTCPARGITSTAAVLPDPVTGTSTVYVSGARFLYALKAATGALVWKTEIGPASAPANAYYNWSSPTVAGGHIYVGLSSSCDKPLIRGGVVELSQHTGQVLHTWRTVPAGSIGGSVWTSVAASSSGSDLWVSTGNECDPTINTCPAGALYLGGDGTTIGGTGFGGSIRRVDPVTGGFIWQTGLPCAVMGTPTVDGAGVLAVGTYSCVSPATPGAYLISASTGAILKTLPVASGRVFGQPVFSQGALFVATETHGLYSFAP